MKFKPGDAFLFHFDGEPTISWTIQWIDVGDYPYALIDDEGHPGRMDHAGLVEWVESPRIIFKPATRGGLLSLKRK